MHFLIVILPALALQIGDCRYSEPRSANLDASAAQRLVVTAGSGLLEVVGVAGLREARVRATACASDRDLLAGIDLSATRSGNDLRVRANDQDYDLGPNEYARLDVVIEVPAGIAADITDGSGDLELSGLGDLVLEDGSGSITARDLRGTVEISDGSGELVIDGVGGDLFVNDGSGELDLRNIRGRVQIEDGSGEIKISGVQRDVLISDSSGDIQVDEVAGNFTVRNDSSGGIDFARVRGTINIPRRR